MSTLTATNMEAHHHADVSPSAVAVDDGEVFISWFDQDDGRHHRLCMTMDQFRSLAEDVNDIQEDWA